MNIEICDNPIFVIGAPRSGTSMMQWSLRAHPDLWGGPESDFLLPLLSGLRKSYEFGTTRGRLHWLSRQEVSWDEYLLHAGYGVNSLFTNRSKGLVWVEQSPVYTLFLGDMVGMFPGARFVYMLRDGRSVVHSLRNFVNPMTHDKAIETWVRYTRAAMAFADSDYGDAVLTVRYENVVGDTESAVSRIHKFLHVPFEEASVAFIESNRPINSSFDEESSTEKLSPRWTSWTPEERALFDQTAGELLIDTVFEDSHDWTGP